MLGGTGRGRVNDTLGPVAENRRIARQRSQPIPRPARRHDGPANDMDIVDRIRCAPIPQPRGSALADTLIGHIGHQ